MPLNHPTHGRLSPGTVAEMFLEAINDTLQDILAELRAARKGGSEVVLGPDPNQMKIDLVVLEPAAESAIEPVKEPVAPAVQKPKFVRQVRNSTTAKKTEV